MSNSNPYKHEIRDYPLIRMGMTREDCLETIQQAGLPIPPKSSCFFCPFHNMSGWREMKRTNPDLFERVCQLEETKNAHRAEMGKDPMWMCETLRPLRDSVDMEVIESAEPGTCDVAGYCGV